MTHPFSPLRVRALRLFDDSVLAKPNGTSIEALEAGVQVLMTMMEPSYLEGRTDSAEAMRRLLFAGAIAVANADDEISDQEIAVFEKFFGERSFRDELNIEKLTAGLGDRIAQATALTTVAQRMQIIRDLCTVARADKDDTGSGEGMIRKIASELEVPAHFVSQAMSIHTELD